MRQYINTRFIAHARVVHDQIDIDVAGGRKLCATVTNPEYFTAALRTPFLVLHANSDGDVTIESLRHEAADFDSSLNFDAEETRR
jgi:hypothetical protein